MPQGKVGVEEYFLPQVFHEGGVSHEPVDEIQKGPVVFLHEKGEGFPVPGLNLEDDIPIFQGIPLTPVSPLSQAAEGRNGALSLDAPATALASPDGREHPAQVG